MSCYSYKGLLPTALLLMEWVEREEFVICTFYECNFYYLYGIIPVEMEIALMLIGCWGLLPCYSDLNLVTILDCSNWVESQDLMQSCWIGTSARLPLPITMSFCGRQYIFISSKFLPLSDIDDSPHYSFMEATVCDQNIPSGMNKWGEKNPAQF